jgi:hypothetical protein
MHLLLFLDKRLFAPLILKATPVLITEFERSSIGSVHLLLFPSARFCFITFERSIVWYRHVMVAGLLPDVIQRSKYSIYNCA